MKNDNTTKKRGHIDLNDLSFFLRNEQGKSFNLDNHEMQIIEEVIFLCVNENFIKDVQTIRKKIIKKFPKIFIPTDNPHDAERILCMLYENHYEFYKNNISGLIEKYKLLPNLYWQDQFFMLDGKIDNQFEKFKYFGNKISKAEARFFAINEITNNIQLGLLDSIVIRNKPFSRYDIFPFWANPFLTRKTDEISGITINIRKGRQPYLEIGFSPYSTLSEIQETLKKNYKKIQEYREANLPIPARRDHRKDNLPKMIDAYLLDCEGKESVTIANTLDKKYKDENTLEGVSQLIKRIKKEAQRFNEKQEI